VYFSYYYLVGVLVKLVFIIITNYYTRLLFIFIFINIYSYLVVNLSVIFIYYFLVYYKDLDFYIFYINEELEVGVNIN